MGLMRNVILSLMMGVGSSAFFETMLERRAWKWKWAAYTDVLAVTVGFLIIAYSRIPAYVLQPVRVIAVFFVVQQIYYRGKITGKLCWAVLLCMVYWILSGVLVAVVEALPVAETLTGAERFAEGIAEAEGIAGVEWYVRQFLRARQLVRAERIGYVVETMTGCAWMCLMLVFCSWFGRRVHGMSGRKLERYGYFPVVVMVVIMAVSMMSWDGTAAGGQMRLVAISGIAVLSVCGFYYITGMLRREEELQRMALQQERAQNQMSLYRSMQKQYEQQRRYLHDYKNQLNCIQGMLDAGQEKEAQAYIAGLTGSLKKHADYVDTGHAVVNVVLNQKYQEAAERGITMVLAASDLSGLRMAEEDLVTLLVNLLDNAIEACERFAQENGRMIWFKMVMEDGQLVLAVRNPVDAPVEIRGKTILSKKRDGASRGIGLQNVDEVVRRNGGVSTLVCEGGYFYFSAVFEVEE